MKWWQFFKISGNALWSISHAAWLWRQDLEVSGSYRNGFNSYCNVTCITKILIINYSLDRQIETHGQKPNWKQGRRPTYLKLGGQWAYPNEQKKQKKRPIFNVIKRILFTTPINNYKKKVLVHTNSYFFWFFLFLHFCIFFTPMMNLKIVNDDYKIKYFCMKKFQVSKNYCRYVYHSMLREI